MHSKPDVQVSVILAVMTMKILQQLLLILDKTFKVYIDCAESYCSDCDKKLSMKRTYAW